MADDNEEREMRESVDKDKRVRLVLLWWDFIICDLVWEGGVG